MHVSLGLRIRSQASGAIRKLRQSKGSCLPVVRTLALAPWLSDDNTSKGPEGVNQRVRVLSRCFAQPSSVVASQPRPFNRNQRLTSRPSRDGVPGLVSRKGPIVIVRPAAREFQIGGKPVFVVAIYNRSRAPEEFAFQTS